MTDRAAVVEKIRSILAEATPATFPAPRNQYAWLRALAVQWMRRDAAAEVVRMGWRAANDPVYTVSSCNPDG
jgi:hypothetical protein